MGDWEWIAYACASALLGGALPSFVKTGVHRTPPSVAAAIYATAVFLFSLGAAAISGTLGSVSGLDNATLVNLVLCGALRALVWLCLFAALSTGNVNRVMPVHNLAPALAIGASALLFDTAIGVWRLCCCSALS